MMRLQTYVKPLVKRIHLNGNSLLAGSVTTDLPNGPTTGGGSDGGDVVPTAKDNNIWEKE